MFLTLLIRNWRIVVIAALLAVISVEYVYIKHLNSEIIKMTDEKELLERKLVDAKNELKVSLSKIDEQNSAIDRLKKESDDRQKRNLAEMAKVKQAADAIKRSAEEIIRLKPPVGIPVCDSANALINQELQNAKK